MRWLTKKKKKEAFIGDIRFKIKFAFLPTKTSQGYTVWLEEYQSMQKLCACHRVTEGGSHYHVARWIEIEAGILG